MSDQGGTLLLTTPYTTSESRSALYIAQTSTWSVTTALRYYNDGHNGGSTTEVGLGFINSSSHNYSFVGAKTVAGGNSIFAVWTDANSHSSASGTPQTQWVNNTGGIFMPSFVWYRITYGATNRTYEISFDGVNFQQVYSESRNTTFTPDAAAIIVSPKSGGATNTNLGANLLVNIFDWH